MWPGCPASFSPVVCGAKECTKVLHHMCQNNWEDELCRDAFPDQPWPPVLPEEGLSKEGMFDNPFEQYLWRCYDCYVPIGLDKARAARASANTKGSTSTIPSGVNDDDEDDASSIYSGISSDSDISVISIVTQATTGVAPKATSRVIRNKLKRASDAAADGLEVINLEAGDLESDTSHIIDPESDAHLIKPTNKKSLFWTFSWCWYMIATFTLTKRALLSIVLTVVGNRSVFVMEWVACRGWVFIPSKALVYHAHPHGLAFDSNPTYRVS